MSDRLKHTPQEAMVFRGGIRTGRAFNTPDQEVNTPADLVAKEITISEQAIRATWGNEGYKAYKAAIRARNYRQDMLEGKAEPKFTSRTRGGRW